MIVLIPFILILKQPDLGTALVLYPIALVMFYIGGVNKKVVFYMSMAGLAVLTFVTLMFLGVISHEEVRPYATSVIKEYQYERLNPNTYHQKAAQTAIALGGISGSGWHKSAFMSRGWLPEVDRFGVSLLCGRVWINRRFFTSPLFFRFNLF